MTNLTDESGAINLKKNPKMSLFKARDWWATYCGSDEEFDTGCISLSNIDNNASPSGKLMFDHKIIMKKTLDEQWLLYTRSSTCDLIF